MLLRRYVTDVFDPTSDEICSIGETTLASVMKRTHFTRSIVKVRSRLTSNFRYVAAIVVLLGVASVFLVDRNAHIDSTKRDMPLTETFRGAPGGAGTTTAVAPKEDHPIAYLVDVSGNIELSRDGKKSTVKSSCELLNSGDELSFSDGAKGKVMYEDAFYNLAGPVRYRITLPDPLKIDVKGSDNPIEPQFTTRGAHLGVGNTETISISPAIMLAQVIPPTTRAGDAEVIVRSPRGACYETDQQTICITGDAKAIYSVSVLDMERVDVGGKVQMKGSSSAHGKDLFTTTPEDECIYSIKVVRDGKTVNEVSASTFWFVGDEERKKIKKALQQTDSLTSEMAKNFFRANVLYANGCYSEAYLLSVKLCEREPNTMLYLNLMKLCAKALNFKL